MQPGVLLRINIFLKETKEVMKDEVERENSADGGQLDFVNDGSFFLLGLLLFLGEKQHFYLKLMLIK